MPVVSALYRYPVKGLTPEPRESLVVRLDGRAEGDRVLAFRYGDAVRPEERDGLDYWPKSRGLSLMDYPGLARLRLRYDADALSLRLSGPDGGIIEAGLDGAGRRRLADRVTEFVLGTPEGRLLRRAGRLPVELVGDGMTARFQDRPRGYLSLHGGASAEALAAATGLAADHRRFRSNIVVDGVEAWGELSWTSRVRIGDVEFTVEKPIVRCLAIQADPDTGERDAPLLRTLTREFAQREPTLGVLMLPTGGGTLRVGDTVTVCP